MPQLLEPNPRVVSRELLTRDEFKPATIAERARRRVAAVRGARLVQPRQERRRSEPFELELARRRPVARAADAHRAHARATRATRDDGDAADLRHRRHATGGTARRSTAATRRFARASARATDGKLRLDPDGLLPRDLDEHVDLDGRRRRTAGSAWRSCTRSSRASTTRSATGCARSTRPGRTTSCSTKARLINAALMAKIHTVEWTPAIIAHPTTQLAMRANWWGLMASGSQAPRPNRAATRCSAASPARRPTTTACRTR